MSVYKIPIEYSFLLFPFVALLLTLPFLIHQYRKFGAVPILRATIFYSFILYLLTAYFMVILPLPDKSLVAKLTTPKMQLIPFNFINDIIKNVKIEPDSIASYLSIIKNNSVYTLLFNIILTIPFGVYLRYYFKCNFKKTVFLSFFLSLFFELTQLSGLYFIYPRPYRLFDVDDLIINTLGGIIGYLITPIFMKVLPTRKELDIKSYKKGENITLFRRLIAFQIDLFFLMLIGIIIKLITYTLKVANYWYIITIIIYYLIIPLFLDTKTLGKKILKIKILSEDGTNAKWYQVILRYILGPIIIIYYPTFKMIYGYDNNNNIYKLINSIVIIYIITNYISVFIMLRKKDKMILYEKITKTKEKSTIEYIDEKDDIINDDNNSKNKIEKEEKNARDKKNK